jgi:DNA-binding phage protein
MTSFQITITPTRRAAARFITDVRRKLQKAAADEKIARGVTQSSIARDIGVHRSVINRELRGQKDLTLGRVAELAAALGRDIQFELVPPKDRGNHRAAPTVVTTATTTSGLVTPTLMLNTAAAQTRVMAKNEQY